MKQVGVRLFSNRSQVTSKCGKNISDTLDYRLVCSFVPILPNLRSVTEKRHRNVESICGIETRLEVWENLKRVFL